MSQTVCLAFTVTVLLMTAQRLPAPIQETPESATPAPSVAAEPVAKPRKITKRKSSTEELDTPARSRATPAPKPAKKFAGFWEGTIPAFPTGPQETILEIDPTETTMRSTWKGHPPSRVVKAEITGGTIKATFPNGLATYTYSLTPEPGDTIAQARLQALMNNSTAVFHRTDATPPHVPPRPTVAATTTKISQTGIPKAMPAPGKPGFVYNPFNPTSPILLDVRGIASGTKATEPNTGKTFIVP